MNITTTGTRTVLAAAAAGALILGSAGGSVAAPDKAQGPKAKSTTQTTKLQNVNIKRHKKIDLADADAAQTALKLRAKVRYSKKVSSEDALQSFEVKLGVFDKKVNGEFVEGSASGPGEPPAGASEAMVELRTKKKEKDRKNQFYAGDAVIADVWTSDQIGALATAVATNGKAYICTYSVDNELFDAFSVQTRKRLGTTAEGTNYTKKTVRDCVKVVNSTDTGDDQQEPTS